MKNKILCRIITQDEINHYRIPNYCEIIDNIDNLIIDDNCYYLINSYFLAKKLFSNTSILNKQINDKVYWEYSFSENKKLHVNGISDFIENIPEKYYGSIYDYKSIDLIDNNIDSVDKLIKPFLNHKFITYNNKNEYLYIYFKTKIYGINLKELYYHDLDVDFFLEKIKECSIRYIYDKDSSILVEVSKKYPFFFNIIKYVGAIY